MISKKRIKFKENLKEYKKETSTKTMYNLPAKVEFCKTCLMSNQKPAQTVEHRSTEEDQKLTIEFKDGVCHACRYRKTKEKDIDWEKREHEFKLLMDKYRSRNGSYDCVCPGSGGKDSFKVAHELKYKYGMNPITCTLLQIFILKSVTII